MSKKNIHIIGGAGGIGKWMIEKIFFQNLDKYDIYCYDINKTGLELIHDSIKKCLVSSSSCCYKEYEENFKKGDWIVFAVPINSLKGNITAINSVSKNNTLYVSLTSTQVEAMATLKSNASIGCSYVGCHPLFGPSLSSPVAQIAALVDFNADIDEHIEFKSCLNSTGLLTSEISSKSHDENMAVIQALTHFTYLSFAKTIGGHGYKPETLLRTTTPNFQFLYAFASRILKITPTTTGSIQCTQEAAAIRSHFIDSANQLNDQLSGCSVEDAAHLIEDIRAPFSGKDVEEGVEIAAIAVESVQRTEELFYRYKKIKQPFIFRHRGTSKLHIVLIVDIHRDSIDYIESTKRINVDGKVFYALGLNEQSRKNHKRQGFNLQKPYKETIKKRNIELLKAGELNEFHKNDILPVNFKFSLENPHGYDESYFESWLPLLVKGLWRVRFTESYRRRGQIERVSLDIEFNPEVSKSKITNRIINVIENRLIEDNETNKTLQRTLATSRH